MEFKNDNIKINGTIEASGFIGMGILSIYLNDVLLANNIKRRYYTLSISGGSGIAQVYLTSDGLTKSVSNTFLFTTVLYGSGNGITIENVDERPIFCGFNYNAVTGLARFAFNESKNTGVLIGGTVEGLEAKENAYIVSCYVEGY